jgi:hypothetical protein
MSKLERRGEDGKGDRPTLLNGWDSELSEFARDSPLEESGFESLVPLATEMLIELAKGITNQSRMLAVGDIGPVPRLC